MRIAVWGFLAVATGLFGSAGCSSSDSAADAGAGTNIYDTTKFKNGQHGSEMDACQALVAALTAQANKLSCGPKTFPTCPNYLRQSEQAPGGCMEWDMGQLNACVAHVPDMTCADIGPPPCLLGYYESDPATGLCASPADGGSDAADDAAPSEAGDEADAGLDDAAID